MVLQLQYTRASMRPKSSVAGNQEPPTRLAGLAMLVRGPPDRVNKKPRLRGFLLVCASTIRGR
ncbi:hypothetical protein XAP6164_150005 [Xanthomonas phaseoli pv. phaseoli]|uniref:Uncharacterized protein n=1 Tax=Xanthomonas campestris pv. phaseoli TaxID=317013 RepID=A0AB38DWH4_XANCH|nr:hypothetical protein XAP7430_1470006 [Xanthomonas phaseoli pv. phaseoli]SOO27309.1 hypothetical protein XAP6164_150005 [Xanthomonas phaseoli pv. phaseoli]